MLAALLLPSGNVAVPDVGGRVNENSKYIIRWLTSKHSLSKDSVKQINDYASIPEFINAADEEALIIILKFMDL